MNVSFHEMKTLECFQDLILKCLRINITIYKVNLTIYKNYKDTLRKMY